MIIYLYLCLQRNSQVSVKDNDTNATKTNKNQRSKRNEVTKNENQDTCM